MSKIWSGDDMPATPITGFGSFGSLGQQGSSFRTIYGNEGRGTGWNPGSQRMGSTPAAELVDPIEEAAREAFLQGFQEGERIGREAAEADNEARVLLASAIQHVAQSGEGTLAAMISQAVTRLVGQIMGDVAIDEALLKERCAAVAACIDSDESHVLEVNPDDLPLLEKEEMGVMLTPNPDLPRGSVRLATSDGWVEDGPDIRLARLKALLDDMEGRR